LKKFLPACDRQGGIWRIFSLVLRIAFQRNGEFLSRHAFLDDELFHEWIGARQAFGVSGCADVWIVSSIAREVTCSNAAYKGSDDRLVQMSVGMLVGNGSRVKQDQVVLASSAEIEWHVPS